jgi:hypothetical protein
MPLVVMLLLAMKLLVTVLQLVMKLLSASARNDATFSNTPDYRSNGDWSTTTKNSSKRHNFQIYDKLMPQESLFNPLATTNNIRSKLAISAKYPQQMNTRRKSDFIKRGSIKGSSNGGKVVPLFSFSSRKPST